MKLKNIYRVIGYDANFKLKREEINIRNIFLKILNKCL